MPIVELRCSVTYKTEVEDDSGDDYSIIEQAILQAREVSSLLSRPTVVYIDGFYYGLGWSCDGDEWYITESPGL